MSPVVRYESEGDRGGPTAICIGSMIVTCFEKMEKLKLDRDIARYIAAVLKRQVLVRGGRNGNGSAEDWRFVLKPW